jgi:hypothetical protein
MKQLKRIRHHTGRWMREKRKREAVYDALVKWAWDTWYGC